MIPAALRSELETLATWLDDNGFAGIAGSIRDDLADDPTVATFRRNLPYAIRDVWQGFAHVGEEEERPVYERADEELRRILDALVTL